MRWFCTIFVSGWFMAIPTMGVAVASDLPPPDLPSQWRVVTQEDGTSTSECIGLNTSPLCVVETEIACWTRKDSELCRRAEGLAQNPKSPTWHKPKKYEVTRYRFAQSWVSREKEIPRWFRHACQRRWLPGDLVVDVMERRGWRDERGKEHYSYFIPSPRDIPTHEGRPKLRNTVTGGDAYRYVLRRTNDAWHLVTRDGPGEWAALFNGECYE